MRAMNDSRIAKAVRVLAIANAVLWAALGVGWYSAQGWAVALWPWPEVPMTFVFLASIAGSIAVIWAMIAWTGEVAALSGVGLNIVVASAGAGTHLLRVNLVAPAVLAFAGVAGGVLLFAWARLQPVHDTRAMPPLVRGAFVAFTVTLIVAGGALSLQQQVFPWQLHPWSMVLVGAIFLGAAAYFAHAALHPSWAYAAPPLSGFLAYDLILFAPYLRMLSAGGAASYDDYGCDSVNMTSLSIYLTVLGASTALALYYLLLDPVTRLVRRRADVRAP